MDSNAQLIQIDCREKQLIEHVFGHADMRTVMIASWQGPGHQGMSAVWMAWNMIFSIRGDSCRASGNAAIRDIAGDTWSSPLGVSVGTRKIS